MHVTSTAFLDHQLEPEDLDRMAQDNAEENFRKLQQAAILCNDATVDPATLSMPNGGENYSGQCY